MWIMGSGSARHCQIPLFIYLYDSDVYLAFDIYHDRRLSYVSNQGLTKS